MLLVFLRRLTLCLIVLFSLNLPLQLTVAQQSSTADILAELGGYPCPDSEFTCIALTVPLDHFAAATDETLEVVFGVLPATGERKGMFVTATGGPGTSGLASANSYTGSFDPSIPEHFDIVFFDQRGAYQSGNLQCTQAAITYYGTDQRADTPEEEAALVETARTFAEDCITEMGIDPNTLPFYGTNQAAEDLELFRQALGDDRIWLYGESYGTQFVQIYAATHPDHVAGLILDGPVDLTLSGYEYYREQTQAFNDVLKQTLQACTEDELCAADVANGDAAAFYDELAAELATVPFTISFPLASGLTMERPLSLPDLEVAATGFLYSQASRLLLQRALAAASQGDYIPLARVVYNSYGVDPETLIASVDPTYSDALFYAVECNDYNYDTGTVEESVETFLRAGDESDSAVPHFSSLFYADMPCLWWPSSPPAERPALFVGEEFTTLVLGATADPATPVENARRIFSHLADGYLILADGGPHVIYGRGNACPDDLVTAFLVDDTPPDSREITCEGTVADPYISLPPADAADYADVLEALDTAYNEIYYLPDYYYWDYESLVMVACPHGGVLGLSPAAAGDQFRLSNCAFSKGFAMTGTGLYDYDTSDFTLEVQVSGLADGTLSYRSDAEGVSTVTGDYGGEAVELSS